MQPEPATLLDWAHKDVQASNFGDAATRLELLFYRLNVGQTISGAEIDSTRDDLMTSLNLALDLVRKLDVAADSHILRIKERVSEWTQATPAVVDVPLSLRKQIAQQVLCVVPPQPKTAIECVLRDIGNENYGEAKTRLTSLLYHAQFCQSIAGGAGNVEIIDYIIAATKTATIGVGTPIGRRRKSLEMLRKAIATRLDCTTSLPPYPEKDWCHWRPEVPPSEDPALPSAPAPAPAGPKHR